MRGCNNGVLTVKRLREEFNYPRTEIVNMINGMPQTWVKGERTDFDRKEVKSYEVLQDGSLVVYLENLWV